MNFDTISFGNHEQVFNQDKCPGSSYSMSNKLKPYELRKICIDYLKQFFLTTAQLEWTDIDVSMQKQIDDQFTGESFLV